MMTMNTVIIATLLFVRSSTSGAMMSESSTGWDRLQTSFKPVGFVPYRDYSIYVFESIDYERSGDVKNQYFYTPILLLEPSKTQYEYLALKGEHAVSIDIVMWNDEAENTVIDYMQQQMEMSVRKAQVKPIPFEALMLKCETSSASSNACKCPGEWQLYQLHKAVTFSLICPSKEQAESTAEAMRTRPKQFRSAFDIKTRLHAKLMGRKQIAIEQVLLFKGELFSKINQRFRNKEDEVLLTPADAAQLLNELASNVKNRSFSEDIEKSSGNEINEVLAVLRSAMTAGERFIDSQSEELWKTVFWSEDSLRPDKIASELNDVYNKIDRVTRRRLTELVKQISSGANGLDLVTPLQTFYCLIGGIKTCPATSESLQYDAAVSTLRTVKDNAMPASGLLLALASLLDPRGKTERADVEAEVKQFEEKLSKIEWNGKRFIAKPMKMTRVNLANLRSNHKISVSFSSADLSLPVNINLDRESSQCNLYEGLDARLRQLTNQVLVIAQSTNTSFFGVEEALLETKRKLHSAMRKKETSLSAAINKEKEAILNEILAVNSTCARNNEKLVVSLADANKKLKNETALIGGQVQELKTNLLATEASMNRVINKVKRSISKKISAVNSTCSNKHNELQGSLATLKTNHEQEAARIKRQSVSISELRGELSQLQSTVRSVEEAAAQGKSRFEQESVRKLEDFETQLFNFSTKNDANCESLSRRVSQLDERIKEWTSLHETKTAHHERQLDRTVSHEALEPKLAQIDERFKALSDWRTRFEQETTRQFGNIATQLTANSSTNNDGFCGELSRKTIDQLVERIKQQAASLDRVSEEEPAGSASGPTEKCDNEIIGEKTEPDEEVVKEISDGMPYHWRDWCVAIGEDSGRVNKYLYMWSDAVVLKLWDESEGFFYFVLDGANFTMYSLGILITNPICRYSELLRELKGVRSQIKPGTPSRALFPPDGATETSTPLTFGAWSLSPAIGGELIIRQRSTKNQSAIILRGDLPGFLFQSTRGTTQTFTAAKPLDRELAAGCWAPCSSSARGNKRPAAR